MKRYVPIASLLILAAVVRLYALGRESIWFDEALTQWLSKEPYSKLIEYMKYFEQTPPLNHIVTGWFVALFGDSETVLRLPAALAGIGAVAAIYAIGRRLGSEKLGLLSALLLALNPYAIYYAQEARGYSMELLLSLLSTHAFLIMLTSFPRGRVYYIAVSVLLLYTHPFGAVVFLCHAAAWVNAVGRRATKLGFGRFVFVFAIVGLLYLPWVPILRLAMTLTGPGFWIPALHWNDVTAAYWIYCNTAVALIGTAALAVVGCAVARKQTLRAVAIPLAILPVIVPIAASIVLDRAMFTPRYGIAAVGGICLLIGMALEAMPGSAALIVAAGLVIAMKAGAGAAPESPGFSREKAPWREMGRELHDRIQPGALVMYSPGFLKIQFEYYVRRGDLRELPFRDNQPYPAVGEEDFWLIVSLPRYATYEFLNRGDYRVVWKRVNAETLILEMRRVHEPAAEKVKLGPA